MASAGEEWLKVEEGDERATANDEDVERKRSDSKIKRLRRKISQGLRLSFIKDDEDSAFAPDEQNTSNGQSPNGASLSITTSTSSAHVGKTPVKPVVRRVASDSVGGRLRKISFENGRRYSAEYSPEDFGPQPLSPYGQLDQYEKLEQLGEGSYATVFKGIYSANGQIVALKEIRLQEQEGAPFTAIREASLLKQLKHANIVRLYDIIHTKDVLMFVFEFVDTDLNAYLERYPRGVVPHNAKLFLFQLLRGLAYIHERKILHRDIKPQNLLINENGELKLADFGLARAKSVPSHTYSHEVVTLWYRPPDVLLGSNDYTTSLDIWGVGCIFVEMITGVALFPGMSDTIDQLNKIWQVLGTPTEETWPGISNYPEYSSDLFYNFLPQRLGCVAPKLLLISGSESLANRMCQFIPKNRITAVDAMAHAYFSDLPSEVFTLPASESIFSVPGVELSKEDN